MSIYGPWKNHKVGDGGVSCKNTALSSRSKTVADQGNKNTESVGLSRTTYEETDCTKREHDPSVEKRLLIKK